MQNNKESFFSIDRLVEFGMGMAMSQQIVQSMNTMMASMQMPPKVQVSSQPLFAQNAISQESPMPPVYQQYANTQQGKSYQISPQQVSQNPAAFAQAGKQNLEKIPPSIPSASEQNLLSEQKIPDFFYISPDGTKTLGPFTQSEVVRFIIENKLSNTTLVWKTGEQNWKKAADFLEIVALIALVPPKILQNQKTENTEEGEEQK